MSVLETFNKKILEAPKALKGALLATVATVGINLATAPEAQAQEMCTVTDANGVPVLNDKGEGISKPCNNDGGTPSTPGTGGTVTGTNTSTNTNTNQNQANGGAGGQGGAGGNATANGGDATANGGNSGGNSFDAGNNYSLSGAMANVAAANAPKAVNECVNTHGNGFSFGNPYIFSIAVNSSETEAIRFNVDLPEHGKDGKPVMYKTAPDANTYMTRDISVRPSRLAVMPDVQKDAYSRALAAWKNASDLSGSEKEHRAEAAGVLECGTNLLETKLLSIKAASEGAVAHQNAVNAGQDSLQTLKNKGAKERTQLAGVYDLAKQRVIQSAATDRATIEALAPSIEHCTNGKIVFQTSTTEIDGKQVTTSTPVVQSIERTKAHHACDPDKLLEILNKGRSDDVEATNAAVLQLLKLPEGPATP